MLQTSAILIIKLHSFKYQLTALCRNLADTIVSYALMHVSTAQAPAKNVVDVSLLTSLTAYRCRLSE